MNNPPAIIEQHWTTDHQEWYRNVYLKSEHWKELRGRKLKENPTCERCPSSKRLDVHHIRYRNIFDVETSDLLTLCRKCHNKEHTESGMPTRAKVSYENYFPQPIKDALMKQQIHRFDRIGMRDAIELADTPEQIAFLLKELSTYTNAHPSTIRKCERAAETRVKQLEPK